MLMLTGQVDLLRALIHEFENRYLYLKSCDQFLIFDLLTTLSSMLQKYDAIFSVDRDSTLRERMRLKQAGKHLTASFVYDLVNIVKTCNSDSYSNIHKVLLLSLTLPLSSAACESGFSHLNIIKSKYRYLPARYSPFIPDAHPLVQRDNRDF